ncbi:MAG TPA: hypothetical protein VMP01_08980 [Pirellulaceae bacterium]|nr:hypothetical protein [Pirellulaceae bacterium]
MNLNHHNRFGDSRFPGDPSPADRVLSSAGHIKVEMYRCRGQLSLDVELSSTIVSREHADDDDGGIVDLADGGAADDAELLDLAESLCRTFSAVTRKRGEA